MECLFLVENTKTESPWFLYKTAILAANVKGNAQFVQKVTFEPSNKTIMKVGNITKPATFKNFLLLRYKNTQLLFLWQCFIIFLWEKHANTNNVNCTGFFVFVFLFLSNSVLKIYKFTIYKSQDCRGRGRAFLCLVSTTPPASQALRHYPGYNYRQLTSAHRWQPDSNREPLVSEWKSLTTKLHVPFKTNRIMSAKLTYHKERSF